MKLTLFLFGTIFGCAHLHAQRPLNAFFLSQYNHTIRDVTKGNNPWSLGIGVQILGNIHTAFHPSLEVTGDLYLLDDKVLRTVGGKHLNSVESMLNVFAGAHLNLPPILFISFHAGPSYSGTGARFGLKPSAGLFLSGRKRIFLKTSYLHIYNREDILKEDFTSYSIAIGAKLF